MSSNLKSIILSFVLFLFPLLFLPTTYEFFATNKFFLLSFGTLLLLVISSFEFAVTKRFVWLKTPFNKGVVLFLIAVASSIIFRSPNKIQALLDPQFGLVGILALFFIYLYLSRLSSSESSVNHLTLFQYSSIILASTTVLLFFQPFRYVMVPQTMGFLKSSTFTPLGSQIDLLIYLGYFFTYDVLVLFGSKKHRGTLPKKVLARISIIFIALIITCVTLVSKQKELHSLSPLPPSNLSWYAALNTLKNGSTAVFGFGVDNFASVFTRVKEISYNQSELWNISSFNISKTAILHIMTETGLFGLISFLIIFSTMFTASLRMRSFKKLASLIMGAYLLAAFLIAPLSLTLMFLLFTTLGLLVREIDPDAKLNEFRWHLKRHIPVYIISLSIAFAAISGAVYFLGRAYAAEVFMRRSLDAVVINDLNKLYSNQRSAVILNPYIESYRIIFSQTNLFIAGQLFNQSVTNRNITSENKQAITQSIQAAINEAKAAVALNQEKASNWENLGRVYASVIEAADGADAWAISSYQRAILLDPQNPLYRLALGGVFYNLKQNDEAIRLFGESIILKPGWPNAYYNLAHAHYQKGDTDKAINNMKHALSLLERDKLSDDYKKASADLLQFQNQEPLTPASQPDNVIK